MKINKALWMSCDNNALGEKQLQSPFRRAQCAPAFIEKSLIYGNNCFFNFKDKFVM